MSFGDELRNEIRRIVREELVHAKAGPKRAIEYRLQAGFTSAEDLSLAIQQRARVKMHPQLIRRYESGAVNRWNHRSVMGNISVIARVLGVSPEEYIRACRRGHHAN